MFCFIIVCSEARFHGYHRPYMVTMDTSSNIDMNYASYVLTHDKVENLNIRITH